MGFWFLNLGLSRVFQTGCHACCAIPFVWYETFFTNLVSSSSVYLVSTTHFKFLCGQNKRMGSNWQCDQMARWCVHYLTISNNKKLTNCFKKYAKVHSKIAKTLIFGQSSKISPNLVTLLTRQNFGLFSAICYWTLRNGSASLWIRPYII